MASLCTTRLCTTRLPLQRFIFVVLMFTSALALSGCGTARYIAVSSYEHAKLLLQREPLEAAQQDPRWNADQRELLKEVPGVRSFAGDTLGLKVGGAYSQYVHVDPKALSWIVMASRRDRFELKTWWFPFVGTVPYKGFLTEKDARAYAALIEEDGVYETSVRPAGAFSTLGWFNDPIVTSMLEGGSLALTNTLIHELFHRTVWVPNFVDFNESSAHAVGTVGAALYFQAQSNSSLVASACTDLNRQRLIYRALDELYTELAALYARSSPTVLIERQELFDRWRARHMQRSQESKEQVNEQDESAPLRETLEKRWQKLNNATLMQSRLYYTKLDTLLDLVGSLGIPEFTRQVSNINGDPWAWLEMQSTARHDRSSPLEAAHDQPICR